MKLIDLFETPLPDKWDKAKFRGDNYADMVEYAKVRAKEIGRGSARVALVIKYQGRDTVLKVALSPKGLAQNKVEVKAFADKRFQELVVPMIDHDLEPNGPNWIHVELCKPLTYDGFKKLAQVDVNTIDDYIIELQGDDQEAIAYMEERLKKKPGVFKWLQRLARFSELYDLSPGDLASRQNWGAYDGRPVLLDVGLSSEVFAGHYSQNTSDNTYET